MSTAPIRPHAGDAYDLAVPPLVRFGTGRVGEAGEVVRMLGRRAWLVGGRRSLRESPALPRLEAALEAAGVECTVVAESAGEPTVDQVAAALAQLPREGREEAVIVAVGGGSAIDLAKAVAAMATNLDPAEAACRDADAAVVDHLEGVGSRTITRWPLPLVAVPTTAGTGAEATRNAVISCPRRRFKKSMRSPLMVPRAAIVDPALSLGCDRETTVASGLDAITQLIESFVCRFARPIPQALVLEALPRAVAALPRVLAAPADLDARAAMSHAAFVSGIALANSGLGMAHGVAAALGVECGTPHGLACALMLPVAMRVNEAAARGAFARLERAVDPAGSGDDEALASAFVRRIERLCLEAGAPRRLADVGLARDRIAWLAENSGGASMRGNPAELDPGRLLPILEAAY
ncbi:MAG: iron-containing alcohol dehydrogenase [Planctomycetia bacterium]|nr:iron-containing alcohol dehydrogenase [Planctomycetia bacterium]